MNPPALTPDVRSSLLLHFRLGNYIATACAAAGITTQTYYFWMRRARAGEEPYASFAKEAREALAIAETRDLAVIQKASADSWQAAAWRLERRYPKRWGKRLQTTTDVSVKEVKLPDSVDKRLALLAPAEAREFLRTLAKLEENSARKAAFEEAALALEGASA